MAFLCSYIEIGLLTKSDIHTLLHQDIEDVSSGSDDENAADPSKKVAMILRAMRHKVQKLSTKVLLDSRFKSIQSSAVASAIVFYARRCCCLFSSFGSILPAWTEEMTKMTFHHPLKHRATLQALTFIFAMEGENVEDLNALVRAEESISSSPSSPEKPIDAVSSPVKTDNQNSSIMVSPVATTNAGSGKDIDLSPVSMTTVFNTISP